MKMTETEMRELDAWIEKQVFGRTDVSWGDVFGGIEWDSDKRCPRSFTTDPAAAMEVLKKGAEKLDSFSKRFHITIDSHGGHWYCNCHPYLFDDEGQETLEIAIALFAKKLFTK